jgi:hypothetical protein
MGSKGGIAERSIDFGLVCSHAIYIILFVNPDYWFQI